MSRITSVSSPGLYVICSASSHLFFGGSQNRTDSSFSARGSRAYKRVMPKYLRLVVVGGNSVGKTAVIEQAVFGKHSPGQVGAASNTP